MMEMQHGEAGLESVVGIFKPGAMLFVSMRKDHKSVSSLTSETIVPLLQIAQRIFKPFLLFPLLASETT